MCRPPPPALVLQQSKEAVVDEAVLLLQARKQLLHSSPPKCHPHFSLASRSAMPAVSGSWVTLPPAGFRAARIGSVTTSRPVAVDRDQERAACKRQWTTAIQAGGWAWFFHSAKRCASHQPSNQ